MKQLSLKLKLLKVKFPKLKFMFLKLALLKLRRMRQKSPKPTFTKLKSPKRKFMKQPFPKLKCLKLKFPKLQQNGRYILKVYSDSSFNNLPNGGSQGGFIIFLCDSEDNGAPIQWQSKKIRRVAKSTLAAECLAMEDAVDAAFYLKCVLLEILQVSVENVRVECFIDNKSLYDNLHSTPLMLRKRRDLFWTLL